MGRTRKPDPPARADRARTLGPGAGRRRRRVARRHDPPRLPARPRRPHRPDTLSAALTAAAALPTPATGRDPLAELALVALDRDDIDTTGWSDTILTRLTETTHTTLDAAEADPLDPTDPHADPDPDSVTDAPWGDDAYFHALNHPAARALRALLEWGLRLPHGDADPAPPTRLTDVLHAHLREPRQQPQARAALHALIGAYLAVLHERAPQWVDEHADVLLTLPDPRGPHPVRTHLQWGPPVPALLARVDGDELAAAVRVPLEHVARHVAVAHLYDPGVLAPLDVFLTTLAAGPGGPRAVSDLLEETARALPDDANDQLVDVALDLWRTALDTDLPAESVAGAGAFAHARAAEHPDSPAAFTLLTALLQRVHPTHWHTERVRDHARALLAADTPHVSETDRALLRNALLDSGDLDA
ncbi:hypothetical protein [Embleya scabrispora]|uniref:hypothetical protein n=1 Tax=Embleya scabrispora TaxID=159449 RepID=UPI0003AB19EB|nr:hypothetical protein [Embleya scabrispora]MYS80338.1 hypothetical protein [Streptomyces sp. SID5474]